MLISPDKAKQQDFRLSNIKANEPVNEKYFVGVKPGKIPWKVEINPFRDESDERRCKGRPGRRADPKAARRAPPLAKARFSDTHSAADALRSRCLTPSGGPSIISGMSDLMDSVRALLCNG